MKTIEDLNAEKAKMSTELLKLQVRDLAPEQQAAQPSTGTKQQLLNSRHFQVVEEAASAWWRSRP